MNKARHDTLFSTTVVAWPALFVLLLASFLTSCFATTDSLAVYEGGVLNKDEVNTISGSYHFFDPSGSFSSISFTPQARLWPYSQHETVSHGKQTPYMLPAVSMSFKNVIDMNEGGKSVWRIDGVAVFSHIPGTDLILASMAGETLQIDIGEKVGMTPTSGNNKNRNLFFIIKHEGKAMTIQMFSETDKGLKLAFQDIKFSSGLSASSTPPLPTKRLLAYLKMNAANVFDEDNSPTYLRSTPEQKILVKQRIHAAFEEARNVKASQQTNTSEPRFELKVPKEFADQLRKAIQ